MDKVSEGEVTQEVESAPNPRAERMAALSEGRRAQIKASIEEGGGVAPSFEDAVSKEEDVAGDEDVQTDDDPKQEVEEIVSEEASQEDEEASTDGEAPKKGLISVKVNGREKSVSPDDIRKHLEIDEDRELTPAEIRVYQKDLAADEKLRQAASMKTAPPAKAEVQKAAPPQKRDVPNRDALSERLVESIYSGDPDEAKAAIGELFEVLGSPDVDDLVPRITAALQKEEQNESMAKAYLAFQGQFADIVEDQRLFAIADSNVEFLANEHPDWPIEKVFIEAGNSVYRSLGKPVKDAPVKNNPQDHPKRTAPKATQGQSIRAPSKPAPKLPTRAEALNQLRQARGQPTV